MKNQTLQNTKHKIRITQAKAFSLIEATTALIILAFISAGVLVVINRCMASATNSALRMQAFEVARENMEKLLTANSVEQTTEFGTSDKYPEIQWQTVVEAFYEPITERVWVKGVCSAEYTDSAGETQIIELTHWLTGLTKQQVLELLKQQEEEQEQLNAIVSGMIIHTIEEAAEYAGVDVPTVEQWVENGMLTTEDGSFVKDNIDVFKESDGNPTPEAKSQQVESTEELTDLAREKTSETEPDEQSTEPTEETSTDDNWQDRVDPTTGLTYGELEQMEFWEIWDLFMKAREKASH